MDDLAYTGWLFLWIELGIVFGLSLPWARGMLKPFPQGTSGVKRTWPEWGIYLWALTRPYVRWLGAYLIVGMVLAMMVQWAGLKPTKIYEAFGYGFFFDSVIGKLIREKPSGLEAEGVTGTEPDVP